MKLRLKFLRKLNNLTQKDISKILKISQSLYSIYESEKRIIPVKLLHKLAKEYNTSIDFLVGETDEFTPHRINDKL